MSGVKVVEMGFWVAAPSAATILHEWGADVVKVEPPTGDPMRGLNEAQGSAPFQLDNRGKRGVCLDLAHAEAREIARTLIGSADVFVTNMRPEILEGWGLDYATLAPSMPRLVYAQITAYGLAGTERDRPAYDYGAYWARSGLSDALTPEGALHPPIQRGGMGDHMTGMATAGGISAALFERNTTGTGRHVSVSLLRVGMYTLGVDYNMALRARARPGGDGAGGARLERRRPRSEAGNPVFCPYKDSEGKWFWILGLEGDRHFPALARSVGHPEWTEDERFASMAGRFQNAATLVAELDEIFGTKTREHWGEIFDRNDLWWAPVQSIAEVLADEQAYAAGAFVDVPQSDGESSRMVATPVDFPGSGAGPRGPSPELGQHTEEVLLELGHDWDTIVGLKDRGVIP